MKTIYVKASTPYDVFVDKGLLYQSGELIRKISSAKKTVIVTDDIVNKLYAQTLKSTLEAVGFSVSIFTFDNGEKSKSHTVLLPLYEFLCEQQITRNDLLIALGGGVVGDLTGFCAATFLRGVDFVQIPTTLLAQIDSSVGGKTGVNIEGGKNLVGAFKQPRLVICDVDTLLTLPKPIFNDGIAEAIKYGAIKDEKLFQTLYKEDIQKDLTKIIYNCIDIKRQVVENDEFDTGERMHLNFGHTLGHAIEKHFGYGTYSHGQAVGIGMVLMTSLSEKYGITQTGTTEKIRNALEQYNLPVSIDVLADTLIEYSLNDKKRSLDTVNIVLVKKVGESIIYPLALQDYRKFIKGTYHI